MEAGRGIVGLTDRQHELWLREHRPAMWVNMARRAAERERRRKIAYG